MTWIHTRFSLTTLYLLLFSYFLTTHHTTPLWFHGPTKDTPDSWRGNLGCVWILSKILWEVDHVLVSVSLSAHHTYLQKLQHNQSETCVEMPGFQVWWTENAVCHVLHHSSCLQKTQPISLAGCSSEWLPPWVSLANLSAVFCPGSMISMSIHPSCTLMM